MAEEMAKYPKRIISFCRINPNFGPGSHGEIPRPLSRHIETKGIKLHPEIEFFDPNEAELMEPIYRRGAPLSCADYFSHRDVEQGIAWSDRRTCRPV